MFKRLIALSMIMFVSTTSSFAASSLEKEIKDDLTSFNGKVGVFAKNLKTGKNYRFKDDEVFPAASTSKLIVSLAAYKYLYPAAPKEKKDEYDYGVNVMLTVSDNEYFSAFLSEFDDRNRNELSKTVKDLGLRKTQIHSESAFNRYQYHSVTTAYEMGRVLETIYRDKYIAKDKTLLMKQELRNSIFQDEIPRHMETPVVHKIGQLNNLLCDVGIIEDGHAPILVSVYTITDDERYASDFIAAIAAKLYNALR